MIHFVIPLRSAQVAASWDDVCALLDDTLRSIRNQTSDAHRTVLVCHETPPGLVPGDIGRDGSLDVVNVDFDPPGRSGDREAVYAAQEHDKFRKMQIGLRCAVDHTRDDPGHVMFVDADDLVSNRIAAFVAEHPRADGWYVERGYTLRADLGRVLPRDGMHLRTNTSHIVAARLLAPELAREPADLAGEGSALPHRNVRRLVHERGGDLRPLPFPGALYITHNGQNLWADHGRMVGFESRRARLTQALGTARYRLLGRSLPWTVGVEFGLG